MALLNFSLSPFSQLPPPLTFPSILTQAPSFYFAYWRRQLPRGLFIRLACRVRSRIQTWQMVSLLWVLILVERSLRPVGLKEYLVRACLVTVFLEFKHAVEYSHLSMVKEQNRWLLSPSFISCFKFVAQECLQQPFSVCFAIQISI